MVTARAAADPTLTPRQVRELCRADKFQSGGTPGYAPGYVQVNVIILPSKYASDFRTFCKRNPVPCPLLGETKVGDPTVPSHLAKGSDIRTDCGLYRVYQNGELVEIVKNVEKEWTEDSVAFFIGCSYTFESALVEAGLPLRHVEQKAVIPCYKTTVPLCQAGVFKGNMVVSMRPYRRDQIPLIQKVCRPFGKTHGEPVAFGPEGAAALGVDDVDCKDPTWGEPVTFRDDEIPVYWGCGVTPQQVVLDSKIPERVMAHSAGFMLVTDMKTEDICEED